MTPTFERGDRVKTPDGTLATFVRLVDQHTAIIGIGPDSRLVDPVVLRKVEG